MNIIKIAHARVTRRATADRLNIDSIAYHKDDEFMSVDQLECRQNHATTTVGSSEAER